MRLGLFDGDCESLVIRSCGNSNSLLVDKTIVPEGVHISQIVRLLKHKVGIVHKKYSFQL